MRRRILMAALWLAGTLGATGVVFTAVGKLSTNLSSIGDDTRSARLGPGNVGPTTVAEPFITTTSSSSIVAESTTAQTVAETTTTSEVVPPVEDTSASPGTQPPTATPAPVRPTPAASPTVPVVTATPPPPTVAPPTAAPSTSPTVATTASPPVTSPESCKTGRRSLTGRNTVLYQVCTGGVSLTQALPAPGWSVLQPVVVGPPFLTVVFTNGSSTATCTIRTAGEGNVDTNLC